VVAAFDIHLFVLLSRLVDSCLFIGPGDAMVVAIVVGALNKFAFEFESIIGMTAAFLV